MDDQGMNSSWSRVVVGEILHDSPQRAAIRRASKAEFLGTIASVRIPFL
jgi:hypothetical protein